MLSQQTEPLHDIIVPCARCAAYRIGGHLLGNVLMQRISKFSASGINASEAARGFYLPKFPKVFRNSYHAPPSEPHGEIQTKQGLSNGNKSSISASIHMIPIL